MEELDLLELTKSFIKGWKTILFTAILGGLIGFLCVSFLISPVYRSTAKIYIKGTSAVSSTLADLQLGTYLSNDYEVIFKSRPVLEKTLKELKMDINYQDLQEMINVSTISNTRILKISCDSNDPELSKNIVNTIVSNGIKTVNEIDAKQPYVIEQAIVNTTPVSASVIEATLFGIAGGVIVGLIYIFIQKVLNDKIFNSQDIETHLNVAVLGIVPKSDKIDFLYKKEKNYRE